MDSLVPIALDERLDPIGYRLKIMRKNAWDRVAKVINARDDKNALTACEIVLKRTDPIPRAPEDEPGPRTINVVIVSSSDAQRGSATDGRDIRVVSGPRNGSAGDRVLRVEGRREDVGGAVGDGDARG